MYDSVWHSRYGPLGREHAQAPCSFTWLSTFSSQGIIISLISHIPKQTLGYARVERLWVGSLPPFSSFLYGWNW